MVPDLPYVRKDVPDGSEALKHGGFARLSRRFRLRLRSASKGTTTTYAKTRRPGLLVAALAVAVSSALSFTLFAVPAGADKLSDRQAKVKHQITQTRSDLSESSRALTRAAVAVDRAEARLAQARSRLAQTRQELAAAKARDVAMAAKLKKAQADLRKAKAAVKAGQRQLDAQHETAGQMVRDQYQQQNNLLPIAALIGTDSTTELQTRLQWSTTMFDTAQAQIDRLTVVQQALDAAKQKQAALEAQVADDRKAAAANLKVKARLEVQASDQAAEVADLVRDRRKIQRAAAEDVATDKRRYAKLVRERSAVESRIAARIAHQKALARKQAAAERRAAAKRHKAASKSSKSSRPSAKPSTRRSSTPRVSSPGNAGHNFSYPVSAPITSPYGMRFHPVLHYWKLHDGTDFGAGCGTAIRAPYPGRVVEKYYNAGYGNRLMIDHGRVGGSYVTTGYNHAIRYTVSVGQHVDRGQVIGYVGTTGFSTGCHLHLMVWLNGKVINPMRWF